MWRFYACCYLLFIGRIYAAEDPGVDKNDVIDDEPYTGPVVCQGTKPLIFHEDYDEYFPPGAEKLKKHKLYFEPYWEQIVNHVTPCQIIVGNLIIPHQQFIPFEADRLIEALKEVEIVTGFIYIYDVDINIRFAKLKAVYGNELFYYPKTWTGYKANNDAFKQGYAIFVEKFTAVELYMPELLYIKNGIIGFKDTPKACVWNPKKEYLFFDQFFDAVAADTKLVRNLGNSFGECRSFQLQCQTEGCDRCFADEQGYCQKTTKKNCFSECDPKFCDARDKTQPTCCPKVCRGGCRGKECVSCKPGYFLTIGRDTAQKNCAPQCFGVILNGTDICILNSETCPDYMFSFNNKRLCSYRCPAGMEFDPITNYPNTLKDEERLDKEFKKYYKGNVCKPCRMVYDDDKKDFKDDCGIGCAIQSNSLSFFTVLSIYPSVTDMKDYDFKTFQEYFKQGRFNDAIFNKRCRHIYGLLRLDQYSVGSPQHGARLVSDHLRVLTYVTGLYGRIQIENTDSYWFADVFRNLLVIQEPIPGRLDEHLSELEESVGVRFNSDLRSVDLQRLRISARNITVHYNPLYLTPIPIAVGGSEKVFEHVKFETYKSNDSLHYTETVIYNSNIITRVGNPIAYDTGCQGQISYFYKRCVKCPEGQIRYFAEDAGDDQYRELFAECKPKSQCSENGAQYITIHRDGEDQCLTCNKQCAQTCKDRSPFTCYRTGGDEDTLDCKEKVLLSQNIKACADPSLAGSCPNGFRKDDDDQKTCVRCDGACRTCYDNQKDDSGKLLYAIPGKPKKGCRGCGVAFLAKQNDGKWISVCGAVLGAAPRCSENDNCHFLTTNPVRELWRKMKPATPPPAENPADYGEAAVN